MKCLKMFITLTWMLHGTSCKKSKYYGLIDQIFWIRLPIKIFSIDLQGTNPSLFLSIQILFLLLDIHAQTQNNFFQGKLQKTIPEPSVSNFTSEMYNQGQEQEHIIDGSGSKSTS